MPRHLVLSPPGEAQGARSGDVLFETMLGEYQELAERIREAMQARLPAYRSISRQTLSAEVGLQVQRVLLSASAGHAEVSGDELAELAEIGEARSRQGIPVDDMLRAWRIGVEVVFGYAREVVQRLAIGDGQILDFMQSVLAWSDVAMVATAKAHRRVEVAQAIAEEERRTAFVRGVLMGTLPVAEVAVHAEVYGLDPAGEYVAVRARLGEDVHQRALERVLGFGDAGQRRRGLCAVVDGDIAGFLSEPPPSNIDGVAGFGPPRSLKHLAESYRLAARALMTVQACNLRGAYDIGSLGVRAAVAMDVDLGELLRRRYLEPLAAGGSATELMATLRAYLACGMHVERTAKRLFVHQNTVRYRLTRFEELTGASLHETEALVGLWWALELSGMRL
ncbi:CdaR family transcriptional regulator [Mycobacterium sp. 852002-51163_SCH5372311]|uniref:PucR family transcriptional regulator n=1 Tax=Mycobacterium sp. 852002-51163_SCH5372311 TaxID=1834097 RepID=UPI0009ED486C|nr:helix-turn-helix domain-containing protein [Mycobacterium sp. 852002-51163_SCH5372311]